MKIIEEPFGHTEDGCEVSLYTLTNSHGLEVKITNYGGIITSLKTPDQNGDLGNIVLGFDNLQDYLSEHPCFGALIGRYANRIANGRFKLDGKEYVLRVNDCGNHLHGGKKGFDKVLWDAGIRQNQHLELSYRSRDGEEGYPGNLDVKVLYSLTDRDELKIEYEAVTDKATPVNFTAHSYFNLNANGKSVLNQQLRVFADRYTPVDSCQIPTGEIQSVCGSPFDFTRFRCVGERICEVDGGYDHNFVLNGYGHTSNNKLKMAAELFDPDSGRKLSIYTNQPGMQLYTGNSLNGSLTGPDKMPFRQYSGICLEPQHFPNSPNEPGFPCAILRPGEKYRSSIVYAFTVDQRKSIN